MRRTAAGISGSPHQSPLFALLGLSAAIEADVLTDDTADSYWQRSDRFDMALDLTAGQHGRAAFGPGDSRAGYRTCWPWTLWSNR